MAREVAWGHSNQTGSFSFLFPARDLDLIERFIVIDPVLFPQEVSSRLESQNCFGNVEINNDAAHIYE